MGRHLDVVIDDEISQKNLELYDAYVHTKLLPPANPGNVSALVGDGHEKVLVKCNGGAGFPGSRTRRN